MKIIKTISICVALALLTGCSMCNKSKDRPKPDVSNINIKVTLERFDHDFEKFNNNPFDSWQQTMRSKYGDFYDFYVSPNIIGLAPWGDTTGVKPEAIARFLNDTIYRAVQKKINDEYSDVSQLESELTTAFKYFKYYVPRFAPPKVIAFNSMYHAGMSMFGNNEVVVGLDMFLGPAHADYDSIAIPVYMHHKMSKAYITRYACEVLYNAYFGNEQTEQNETLAEAMVDAGKKLYFLSYILPDAPDSLLLGYTQVQTDWCEKNEYDMWSFFNDKDLLYKNNAMDKTRYLGEGPSTSGMPPESPGGAGNFIGLKIVRKFMEDNSSNISLLDMLTKYDAKAVFAKTKYHPRKAS